MKKLFLMMICSVLFLQLAWADKKIHTTDTTQLPVAARQFITKHFPGVAVSHIKIEKEFVEGKKYDVILTNGFDLDFNNKGEWTEVDGHRTMVPKAILPVRIADYAAKNFPQASVVSIDKDRDGFDVKLSDGRELKFNKNGDFIRFDD